MSDEKLKSPDPEMIKNLELLLEFDELEAEDLWTDFVKNKEILESSDSEDKDE